MKLLLLISVVCFAVALAAPADKQKRDILPGDPRYGTDYHHHHHHHAHENEVQILKAAGGYIGSYTVPDDTEDHSFQVPQSSYGPPSYKASQPLGSDYLAPSDATKSSAAFQVPSTSYGVPDTTHFINNNYLGPAVETKKPELIKTVHTHNFNTEHQISSVEAPISSYTGIKQEEHVHIPQTSYGIPVAKTSIQPSFESVHVQQPAVHKHVEAVSVPQVKVTTSQLPAQTQGVQHSSVSSGSFFPSYPSHTSYSNIPLRTVDHHVHVQVPQPYPVPVTKHVTYPVPVPQAVEVPKPYYVRVPQPVQVTVNRPYAVEVPRAVPYLVPQYIRTSVPVIQHHSITPVSVVAKETTNPVQGFFQNTQSTFQNVLDNLPSFQNPLQGFQNPFENFELPSLPSLPSLPNFPSLPSFPPQQTQTTAPAAVSTIDVSAPATSDSVIIDNPTLKTETIVTKTAVPHSTFTTHRTKTVHTQSVAKDSTPCAGCSVSATSKKEYVQKEYVQPTDANGGYVY